MQFSRSILEIIPARRSWRSYEHRDIPEETRIRLETGLASLPPGPFGNEVRLALISLSLPVDGGGEQPRKLGTYGVIRGARQFIVGAVTKAGEATRAMEDFGFVFEHMVLLATDLGLGTCWLGGTFKRERFGRAVHAKEDEIVPAVSPVGYPRTKGLVDTVFRWAAASKTRKPFSELFYQGDFDRPLTEDAAGSHTQVLEMVRLGPSASNKQPWRIILEGRDFHLYLRRTAGYAKTFAVDLQRIDIGIAMCHFQLAAKALDLPGSWRVASPKHALPPHTTYVASWSG